ncbi:MAG: YggS family pyridoxal phosphate enzyme [Bacteroidetes bacterium GWE2_39_28]|nr:MAG: YggS family pyridoxal phosphate enzyme [Bacteroidetes bacterium GWE2_39_28]OFY15246.1 MAG: YggS family pyridoxal phosphate enzyme [Bacteroidetes bacterium GWF2_39_10]OFZ08073.1 MAG: YggS family pyridoxal phosphate enzyme [Bacteroidetes bacterium RIFOXYB2_FULL_39_7]OFZ12388.1 MAG: YggS family pyridoxal phosphate enzyme [Bacteroidetes bacterium RIFOXYC2_FULL_39_11]HCT93877.1 YggS family pyridoxal phosphate-dependent enzyme [Rikenellaceae bacterium]
MILKENIDSIRKNLPPGVKLVAVSKFKPIEEILEVSKYGVKDFGENRPQELNKKISELPEEINWHFIGHLQTNKIKMIIDKVYLIHSVDSLKLLTEINKEAVKRDITVNCLLQIYIASEETKQGLSEAELNEILDIKNLFTNINFKGLMGMASFTDNKDKVRGEFKYLRDLFNSVKQTYFSEDSQFSEISMGMSGDYKIAIEEGSTIVRIGSLIFGERQATIQ